MPRTLYAIGVQQHRHGQHDRARRRHRDAAITNGGKTYTSSSARLMWNSSPPRAVTSQDFLLGFKRLCQPGIADRRARVLHATIAGMLSYCNAFTALKTTAWRSSRTHGQQSDLGHLDA